MEPWTDKVQSSDWGKSCRWAHNEHDAVRPVIVLFKDDSWWDSPSKKWEAKDADWRSTIKSFSQDLAEAAADKRQDIPMLSQNCLKPSPSSQTPSDEEESDKFKALWGVSLPHSGLIGLSLVDTDLPERKTRQTV